MIVFYRFVPPKIILTMGIEDSYDHLNSEKKWYQYWLDQKYFESKPDERESYTIVIPPPNVTGILHMGHMLNNTIQDVLIRRARMKGYNACWIPGTDHASIATEAKVVAKLKAEGIEKSSLTREEFLKHAWEWTHKHGGIILDQLKSLGASCDWSREAFTLDEIRSESVIKAFIDLHKKGLIYKGYRMVNWDPEAKTTVSDEEVIHKELNSKLYFLKYKLENSDEFLNVATTRPETILGDVAICVNPEDERFQSLIGKNVIVPIVGRSIPIIADEYVDIEFGTGCLKITPAHDINDFNIGKKHNLETIDVFNDDATLNENGLHYAGQDRFVVRKEISKELESLGLMLKVEDYINSVGTSERTGAVIEPRLMDQWFLKMKELSKPALDAVMTDEVALIPSKFKNTYRHWMENVHDWSISRQLWWGHQLPVYYYDDDNFVVAETKEEALTLAKEKTNKDLSLNDLRQDNDVLDTWFSSWLWPISVFDGIRNPENEEINYYYPTRDLVTAPEILFFWVARMIIAGYEYRNERPFEKVYLTGIVRDKQGRKMSKSLGNSPDPIELMKKYSADGVRLGMLLTSPAGNDLPFDEDLCIQGRNFSNKIWNALRLIKGWTLDDSKPMDKASSVASEWFEARSMQVLAELEESFDKYRMSEALMTTYKFIWDDFCSLYLEAIKPAYGDTMSKETYDQAIVFFERLCIMIHPFMPFISEEIWHLLKDRQEGESICISSWPELKEYDEKLISDFVQADAIVNGIRNIRATKNIPKKDLLDLVSNTEKSLEKSLIPLVQKLGNINSISFDGAEGGAGFSFMASVYEFFIPANESVDLEAEVAKLKMELEYQIGFLKSVEKKLSNERFVSNAPEQVVASENKKKEDASSKIISLKARIEELS